MEKFINKIEKELSDLLSELEGLSCEQLKELLQTKQDLIIQAQNDILLLDKSISDLEEELIPIKDELSINFKRLQRCEGNLENAQEYYDRCVDRQGAGERRGECDTYWNRVKEARARLEQVLDKYNPIKQTYDSINSNINTYEEARSKTKKQLRRLRLERVSIRRKIEELNCID